MSRRGTYAVVAAGATILFALVVAAAGPPVAILSRPASTETVTRLPTLTLDTSSASAPLSTGTSTAGPPAEPAVLLVLLVQVVLALAFLAFLAVLVQIIVALVRRPHLHRHVEPSFQAPEVPVELLATAEERMRLVLTGDPRNAIVAAWLNLETSVARTGLPRDPAETSTEYTARVVGTWNVDRARLDDLAALYREARFSTHDLGEDLRQRAAADLETLHADLERIAQGQAQASPAGDGGARGG